MVHVLYLRNNAACHNVEPFRQSGKLVIVLLAGIAFIVVFWFVMHMYSIELETRHSLEKGLNLFIRLSHVIRTPIMVRR